MPTTSSALLRRTRDHAMSRTCCTVLLAAFVLAPLTLAPLGAASLPDTTVPLSCGIQVKGHNSTAEDFTAIKQLGIAYIRRGFNWEGVEKEKGVYDFTTLDQVVAEAQEHGLTVLGCLAFGNKLYAPVTTDEGRAAYATYAATVVGHFRGKVAMWELWNEPNVRTFWGKHGKANSPQYAEEYTALVKAAVPAMRAAVPDCTILAGSVSCFGWNATDPWMETCFRSGMLSSGIDGWTAHPYSLKRPEDYGAAYANARALMAKYGTVLPILNSERGYPIGKELEGFAGVASSDKSDQYQFQAWHFVRQYMNDLMNDVRLTSWYEWSGVGDEVGFSLHNASKELPIATACKVMLAELSGYKFRQRLPLASPEDYALLFTSAAGGRKLVAWTAPAPGKKPDEAVVHAVSIACDATGTLKMVALTGEAGSAAAVDGAVPLTLSGAPQYVTLTTAQQ